MTHVEIRSHPKREISQMKKHENENEDDENKIKYMLISR